jgi:hypothetical protein
MLSPAARKTAQRLGQLLVWGYEIDEAADRLGLDRADARQQLAVLRDELEQLAGLERTIRRCTRCGQVALRHLRGMCIPCARSRPCGVCQRVAVLTKNLCPDCFTLHTQPCGRCGKVTRIRPGGLCSPCGNQTRDAAAVTDQ